MYQADEIGGAMDNDPEQESWRFVTESRDMLKIIEDALLHIENCGAGEEDMRVIFRAANNIKDSAWIFSFTQGREDILEKHR